MDGQVSKLAGLLLSCVCLATHVPSIAGAPLSVRDRSRFRRLTEDVGSFEFEAAGETSQVSESADNRQLVSDSSVAPFIAIGPLVSAVGQNQRMGCTGSLIHASVVLTAAHCLLNLDTGDEATSSEFAPGYNSRQDPPEPLGVANMIDFRIPQSFRDCGVGAYNDCHRRNDFAVVRLDTKYESWLPFGFNDDSHGEETVNTAGYPGDKDNCFERNQGSECNQYHVSCTDGTMNRGEQYVSSGCMAFQGQSGSPMWVYFSDTQTRQIRGVLTARLTGTDGGSSFTIITQEVFGELMEIIASWRD